MENKKKDLTKIALTALILAATTPFNGEAGQDLTADGTFLVAGCPAHGCGGSNHSSKNLTADMAGDAYHTPSSTYQTEPRNGSSSDRGERGYSSYSEESYSHGKNSSTSSRLSEDKLLEQLNQQGKAIYLDFLDSEGKALAIQLASQDSYRDKNLAVKEAQRRMNERRHPSNR